MRLKVDNQTRKAHKNNRVFIINPVSAKSIWVKVKFSTKVEFWAKVKFWVKFEFWVNVKLWVKIEFWVKVKFWVKDLSKVTVVVKANVSVCGCPIWLPQMVARWSV